MSTINMVKYYFYKNKMPTNPKELTDMIALAYQTARDMKLYPKAILIRYETASFLNIFYICHFLRTKSLTQV